MRILMTGKGVSGSWAIRGNQLGTAIGARVIPMASREDCKQADLIVAVKRIPDALLDAIRRSGKPWVWDVVDSYPQPECSTWGKAESVSWLRREINRLKPSGVIWPNARMADDAGWIGPQEVIYHHHRPGIEINPIRPSIQVIAYEGSPRYLEGWERVIAEECHRLGAAWLVNPDQLSHADVVLALRGPGWNGYPQQHWKSNVKLANAHASGTPFIGMPEDGYQETRSGAEYWVKSPEDLRTALRWLESQSAREEVSTRFLQCALPIERVAEQMKTFLCGAKF